MATLKKDQKLVFKTIYSLMQVKSIAECSKGSILQYFRPSLSYHLSLRPFFGLFLSGCFTQVLLYCFIQFSHYVLRVNKWYNRLYVAPAMTYRIYPKYSDMWPAHPRCPKIWTSSFHKVANSEHLISLLPQEQFGLGLQYLLNSICQSIEGRYRL